MNPNTIPFSTCVAAYAGRVGIFLSAWAIVPVGMALGKIAKGPMQLGQWSGAYHNGTEITYGVPVESLKVAPGFWSNFDILMRLGLRYMKPRFLKSIGALAGGLRFIITWHSVT